MTTAEQLRAEGEAKVILRLLTLKFGPLPAEVTATIHTADAAQLLRWTDRVLTADSLEAVFQE